MNEVFKARKLWGGYVSVPDCIVKYAVRTRRKLRVEFEGQYMMIDKNSKYEVTAPNQTAHRTDKYIKKGATYQLYDYFWLPVDEVRPTDWTTKGLEKLSQAWKNLNKPKQMEVGDIK